MLTYKNISICFAKTKIAIARIVIEYSFRYNMDNTVLGRKETIIRMILGIIIAGVTFIIPILVES